MANTTLLALATLALVMLGTCEVHAVEVAPTTAAVGPGAAPTPLRALGVWPDFAAKSFYDAHLSFIVAASHPEVLARRKVDTAPGFVAPRGRYQALNHTDDTTKQLGRARRKGAGSRGRSGAGSHGNRTRALRLLNVSATTFSNRTMPLDAHFGGWLDTGISPLTSQDKITSPPVAHNRTAVGAQPQPVDLTVSS